MNSEWLTNARNDLDTLDRNLIDLLANRFSITRELGKRKAEDNMAVKDPARESEVLRNIVMLAEEKDVDTTLVKNIYELIFNKATEEQKKIAEQV